MAKNFNTKPKKGNSRPMPMLAGVSNYDKLKKVNGFNQFNPFLANTFNKKAKSKVEASSLDDRWVDDEIYRQLLLQNGLTNNLRTGTQNTSYYGLDKKVRRNQLIRLSVHDLVDEVLTKLVDEVVVSTENKPAISLHIKNEVFEREKISEKFKEEVVDYAKKSYKKIVKLYGLEQNGTKYSLWNKAYLFLTEGSQAYEIVWDNIENPKYISAIHEIDSLDTEPFFDQGIQFWKHHKSRSIKEEDIILYDTQVVHIDYASASPNNRMSYLEHLMKAFNDLRIIDETTINWSITNSTFRTIMKIPTKGLSRTQASQAVSREMGRWNDEYNYDRDTGEFTLNGQNRLQMMKSIYMADGASGSPSIENVKMDGADFNNMERNQFFERRFYRSARMPLSRFDMDGGATWSLDTRSQLREEIYFSRMVNNIRDILKMLVLKPLKLELVARYPELAKDDALEAFDIRFNSYNVFEELMEMDILNEKIDNITKLSQAFVVQLPNGGEMKTFANKFLLEKFLPEFDEDDYKRNDELLLEEHEKMFKFQVKQYQIEAKYNPELNIDSMSGVPDNEKIAREAEHNLGHEFDMDGLSDDNIKNYVDTELEDDEESTSSDKISQNNSNKDDESESDESNKDSKDDKHEKVRKEMEKDLENGKDK